MCLSCHRVLSDKIIKRDLKEILRAKNFNGWNSTSLNHVIFAYYGINGHKAKDLASKVLKEYIIWKEIHQKSSDASFFGEPSAADVKDEISHADLILEALQSEEIVTQDEIRGAFFGSLSNERMKKLNDRIELMIRSRES